MAEREDIRARIRAINPAALELLDEIDKLIPPGAFNVTTTEDMTPEEIEMAILEGYLKTGMPLTDATAKTEKLLEKIARIEKRFQELESRTPIRRHRFPPKDER